MQCVSLSAWAWSSGAQHFHSSLQPVLFAKVYPRADSSTLATPKMQRNIYKGKEQKPCIPAIQPAIQQINMDSQEETPQSTCHQPPRCWLIVFNIAKKCNIGNILRTASAFGVYEVRMWYAKLHTTLHEKTPCVWSHHIIGMYHWQPHICNTRQPWCRCPSCIPPLSLTCSLL